MEGVVELYSKLRIHDFHLCDDTDGVLGAQVVVMRATMKSEYTRSSQQIAP